MNQYDRVRLVHALEAAEAAMRFIENRHRDDLNEDDMLLFALSRALEIIGEALSRVSAATQAEAPDLPWAAIVGMRNRVIHAYFDVDRDILWATVTQAVPSLAARLRQLLAGKHL